MKWKCTVCDNIFDAVKPNECPSCKAVAFKLKRVGYRLKEQGWEF